MTGKRLTIGDFRRDGKPGSFQHYFSHILPDGREVCLEACTGGYCVGIYDGPEGNLVSDKKVCTEIEGMLESQIMPGFSMGSGEALQKAVEIANKMVYGKKG
jgi:hypothetical protein